jgi:hypothetical protein
LPDCPVNGTADAIRAGHAKVREDLINADVAAGVVVDVGQQTALICPISGSV